LASMSCISHSTPSVGPEEGFHSIVVMTGLQRARGSSRGGIAKRVPL
jgi:hypothetical protein